MSNPGKEHVITIANKYKKLVEYPKSTPKKRNVIDLVFDILVWLFG